MNHISGHYRLEKRCGTDLLHRGGSKRGGRGGRAPSPQKFQPCFLLHVSADLDPSRFWIPYDVTHCLGMRSSLKCRKVTYKMCVAHPRKWIRFLLASTVLADLDGQNLRFCERRCHEIDHPPMPDHPPFANCGM